jgi:Pyruvate/2-oxoacid:ferredoxin oxidoreductase delta subunit
MVVVASERCCHQRVCAARCPPEALISDAIAGRVGIALAVERCTGCGVCTETCPEQALRLHPAGASLAAEYLVLTAHRPTVCRGCDEPFVARDGEDLCPPCCKDRALFGDLARALRP